MRRYGTENAESTGETCHLRMTHPEIMLPTTLSPTMEFHNKETTRRRKRKQQRHGPFLVQKKDGTMTFRPAVIKGFLLVGVVAFIGVHLFLLRQLAGIRSPAFVHSADSHSLPLLNRTSTSPARVPRELQPMDREKYTIRINTWQRLDQLLVSIDHHASCSGVAQIQVVWCETEDPPDSLLQLHPEKVVIERHEVNSLNERFNVLPTSKTPTLGILSMDDDVLRSCQAIDSGFFQWTKSPSRMVGFDYRVHVANDDGTWKVSFLL